METVLEILETKITASIKCLKDALWQEESKISHQDLISMLSQLDNLIAELVDAFNEMNKPQSEMTSCLEKRVESYQREISQLKEEVSQRKMSVEGLERSKQKLLLGQLAFKLEKALLGKVLEKSGCDTDELNCIEDMERAIKCQAPFETVFNDENEHHWVGWWFYELEAKLGWKNRHTISLRNLKRLRLHNDHSDFSIDEMKTAIAKASRSEKEKRICYEFLEMLKKLEDM